MNSAPRKYGSYRKHCNKVTCTLRCTQCLSQIDKLKEELVDMKQTQAARDAHLKEALKEINTLWEFIEGMRVKVFPNTMQTSPPPFKLNPRNPPLRCILSLQMQTSNLSPPFLLYLLQTYCCSVSAQPTHHHHFYDQTLAPLRLSCLHHCSNMCLPHHPFLSLQKLQHLLFPWTWYWMIVCWSPLHPLFCQLSLLPLDTCPLALSNSSLVSTLMLRRVLPRLCLLSSW